jgi:hypothetical protein
MKTSLVIVLFVLLACFSTRLTPAFVPWKQNALLLPLDLAQNDQVGCSVSLSDNVALVGATGSNSAYVFVTSDGGVTWNQTQKLQASDAPSSGSFGNAVSISGNFALVGA